MLHEVQLLAARGPDWSQDGVRFSNENQNALRIEQD